MIRHIDPAWGTLRDSVASSVLGLNRIALGRNVLTAKIRPRQKRVAQGQRNMSTECGKSDPSGIERIQAFVGPKQSDA